MEMSKKELPIKFTLVHIEEKQFASFENALEKESPIEQEIGFGFGVDIEQQVIGVTMDFMLSKQKSPLLKQMLSCYYKIEPQDFETQLKKEDAVVLPCGFAKHLAMITTGTARGVLFANTKNTPFNQFIIGLVNVDKMFTKDIHIKL